MSEIVIAFLVGVLLGAVIVAVALCAWIQRHIAAEIAREEKHRMELAAMHETAGFWHAMARVHISINKGLSAAINNNPLRIEGDEWKDGE